MRKSDMLLVISILCLAATGCSKKAPESGGAAAGKPDPHASHSHKSTEHDHGHENAIPVGEAELGGFKFKVTASGKLAPGANTSIEVHASGGATPEAWKSLNVYLWVETADNQQASAPVKGTVEGDGLDFHVLVEAGKVPDKLVLRLRQGEQDVRSTLPLGAATPANP